MNLNIVFKKASHWVISSIKKLFLLHATPHEIAFGTAFGVFIGIFPTFGLGGLVVIGMAPVVKFNIPAAFIGGALLSNPLLAPLWIFLSCWIVGIDFNMIKSIIFGIAPLINFNLPAALVGSLLLSNSMLAPLWIFLFCAFGIDYHMIGSADESFWIIFRHYSGIFGMYVAGNAIISSSVSLISYGLTYPLVIWYRKRKENKSQLNQSNQPSTKTIKAVE